jgi:hypothetical protein
MPRLKLTIRSANFSTRGSFIDTPDDEIDLSVFYSIASCLDCHTFLI